MTNFNLNILDNCMINNSKNEASGSSNTEKNYNKVEEFGNI